MDTPACGSTGDTDAVIRRLAARQCGVVARGQLTAAGLAIHAIDYRVKRGRLQAIHRGVYQPGPEHVLACGETGLLSHNSASAFWGLQPPQRPDDRIEVAIRRGSGGACTGAGGSAPVQARVGRNGPFARAFR